MDKKSILRLMVISIVVFQTMARNISQGHQSTIELNKNKVCSHIHINPRGGKNALKEILKEIETNDGKKELCCPCNPGFRLNKTCSSGLFNTTSCVECENGSYISDYAHTKTECIPSTQVACQQYEVFIPSTKTSDSSCECMDGYYKKIGGKCQKHSKCPPGKGVYRKGDSTHDTECEICGPGKVSPLESSTQRCSFSLEVLKHTRNRHLKVTAKTSISLTPFNEPNVDLGIVTTNTTINPINDSNPHGSVIVHQASTSFFEKNLFIIVMICLFGTLLITLLIWWCRKKIQDFSKKRRIESREPEV